MPPANFTEARSNQCCPCKSGRVYSDCCKKRGILWKYDVKGNLYEERRLDPEAMTHIDQLENEFRATFGRNAQVADRLIVLTEGFRQRVTLRAMRKAGIRPELIYGYIKTGLIFTDFKKLSGKDEQLWNEAIDEYYRLISESPNYEPDEDGIVEDILCRRLVRNHTILGNFILRHFNNYRHRRDANRKVETVAGFLISNFVRSMFSITTLVEGECAYDGYNLLRSMYENFLTLDYIYDKPGNSAPFYSQIGILIGTHSYAQTKNGFEKQTEIKDLENGTKIRVPSRWEMAQSLGLDHELLYGSLYRDLSSICHPDLTRINDVMSSNGYDFFNPIPSLNVLLIANFLCFLTFHKFAGKSPCLKILKRDLETAASGSFFELSILRWYVLPSKGATFPAVYAKLLDDAAKEDAYLKVLADSVLASTQK